MSFVINLGNDRPLDPGTYPAVLKSVDEKDTQYGERLRWLFDVPEHGAEVAGFTSRSGSRQSNAYDWATTLNPNVAHQDRWGPKDVVGKECTLEVDVYQGNQGPKNKIVQVKP